MKAKLVFYEEKENIKVYSGRESYSYFDIFQNEEYQGGGNRDFVRNWFQNKSFKLKAKAFVFLDEWQEIHPEISEPKSQVLLVSSNWIYECRCCGLLRGNCSCWGPKDNVQSLTSRGNISRLCSSCLAVESEGKSENVPLDIRVEIESQL